MNSILQEDVCNMMLRKILKLLDSEEVLSLETIQKIALLNTAAIEMDTLMFDQGRKPPSPYYAGPSK